VDEFDTALETEVAQTQKVMAAAKYNQKRIETSDDKQDSSSVTQIILFNIFNRSIAFIISYVKKTNFQFLYRLSNNLQSQSQEEITLIFLKL
jgi:hypothetical protein